MTTTMTRTDSHRPSAPEFDPEGYTCFGTFDLDPTWGTVGRQALVSSLVDQGWSFGGAPHGSDQCSHCGTRIRYAALMGHTATKTLLFIGETCLDNRFSLTKGEFDALRKTASLNREREARTIRLDAFLAEHPSMAYLSYANNIDAPQSNGHIVTLADMWNRIVRYADMSDKAIAYAERIMGWMDETAKRIAAREVEAASLVEAGVEVPEGRIVVEGTVLSTKWYDNDFGGSLKMLVQHESGWKVFGTVPSAIDVEKGSKVRFTGTVTRSNDDALFGFFKRPAKSEVL